MLHILRIFNSGPQTLITDTCDIFMRSEYHLIISFVSSHFAVVELDSRSYFISCGKKCCV